MNNSFTAERSRRATAGKRITELSGESLQQDETFWGHETWADNDSGNESYRSSDEDSEVKQDVFDSDFDESESDHEDEEVEAGEDAEKEIHKEERDKSRQSSGRGYVETTKSKTTPGKPGKRGRWGKAGTKRIVGEGINAGIVLNLPGSGQSPTLQSAPPVVSATPINVIVPTTDTVKVNKKENNQLVTAASFRPTRKNIIIGRQVKSSLDAQAAANKGNPDSTGKAGSKKRKRRRYTQEELLLEAVTVTEPENERWILTRKRMQAESEKEKESSNRDNRGRIIEKFVSRRGYFNTINFLDMDHLPPILARKNDKPVKKNPAICVITGKPAKYLDPTTHKYYYDAAAFKELRRRFDANEPIEQVNNVELPIACGNTTSEGDVPENPIVPKSSPFKGRYMNDLYTTSNHGSTKPNGVFFYNSTNGNDLNTTGATHETEDIDIISNALATRYDPMLTGESRAACSDDSNRKNATSIPVVYQVDDQGEAAGVSTLNANTEVKQYETNTVIEPSVPRLKGGENGSKQQQLLEKNSNDEVAVSSQGEVSIIPHTKSDNPQSDPIVSIAHGALQENLESKPNPVFIATGTVSTDEASGITTSKTKSNSTPGFAATTSTDDALANTTNNKDASYCILSEGNNSKVVPTVCADEKETIVSPVRNGKKNLESSLSPSNGSSRRSPRQRKLSIKLLESIEAGVSFPLLPSPSLPLDGGEKSGSQYDHNHNNEGK